MRSSGVPAAVATTVTLTVAGAWAPPQDASASTAPVSARHAPGDRPPDTTLPPGFGRDAEDGTVQVKRLAGIRIRIDVGVDSAGIDAGGRRRLVPSCKGGEEAQLRAGPEVPVRRDRDGARELGQVLHRGAVGLLDAIVAGLAQQLGGLGERQADASAEGEPILLDAHGVRVVFTMEIVRAMLDATDDGLRRCQV